MVGDVQGESRPAGRPARSRRSGKTERNGEASLLRELTVLKGMLAEAPGRMDEGGKGDFARTAATVARLCESVARLQVAQQKLEAGSEPLRLLRAQMDEVLTAMGLGADCPAGIAGPTRKEGEGDVERPNAGAQTESGHVTGC